MKHYEVIEIATGTVVHKYDAPDGAPIEWMYMEFATHEHREVPAPPAPVVIDSGNPTEWLIDLGAFYDRLGIVQMTVLTSAHPLVRGIIENVRVRKWVDLRRPDVAQGLYGIRSVHPELTLEMIEEILTTPVRPDENMALRITYFNGGQLG